MEPGQELATPISREWCHWYNLERRLGPLLTQTDLSMGGLTLKSSVLSISREKRQKLIKE